MCHFVPSGQGQPDLLLLGSTTGVALGEVPRTIAPWQPQVASGWGTVWAQKCPHFCLGHSPTYPFISALAEMSSPFT